MVVSISRHDLNLITLITIKDEWEKELEQLSEKWERERGSKARNPQFQQEKDDLEKNMTLRRDKKKESLTRKMLEHERYGLSFLLTSTLRSG